jgi:hypothetical protein
VLEVPPGLVAPPAELLLLVLLPLPGLVVSVELVPPGLVALPVLLEPPELRERTAKSILPRPGFMMTSLIVPRDVPELSEI